MSACLCIGCFVSLMYSSFLDPGGCFYYAKSMYRIVACLPAFRLPSFLDPGGCLFAYISFSRFYFCRLPHWPLSSTTTS